MYAPRGPGFVGQPEDLFDRVIAGAFTAFGGLSGDDCEEVGEVLGVADPIIGAAAKGGTKGCEQLGKDGDRIGFG